MIIWMLLTMITAPVEDEVSAAQFLRLVRSQQATIRDVAFAFEGEKGYIGPADGASHPSMHYQGRYALRSDGATFYESYVESRDDRPDAHRIRAVVNGRGEMKHVMKAAGRDFVAPVTKTSFGPGSFFESISPETFHFLWRYQTLKEPTDFGYQFIGWEEIDGHRCAHIEFNAHPNFAGRVRQELWVDLERGGHPLQIRNSDGNQTVYQIEHIKLKE